MTAPHRRHAGPAFAEWFDRKPMTLPEHVARAASCLRALAQALSQRTTEDGWVDLSWLAVLVPIGVGAPQSTMMLGDAHGRPHSLRPTFARRTNVRTRRYWQWRDDGLRWVMFSLPLVTPVPLPLEWEVARVANRRTDLRIGFDAASAPVFIQTATSLEREFGLPVQPPVWCFPRSGWLNGVAVEIAAGFWSMWVAWRIEPGLATEDAGPFDLLDDASPQRAALPHRQRQVLSRLKPMFRTSAHRGVAWAAARVELVVPRGDPREAFIGVSLVSARPFGLTTHWFVADAITRRMTALPLERWPARR